MTGSLAFVVSFDQPYHQLSQVCAALAARCGLLPARPSELYRLSRFFDLEHVDATSEFSVTLSQPIEDVLFPSTNLPGLLQDLAIEITGAALGPGLPHVSFAAGGISVEADAPAAQNRPRA